MEHVVVIPNFRCVDIGIFLLFFRKFPLEKCVDWSPVRYLKKHNAEAVHVERLKVWDSRALFPLVLRMHVSVVMRVRWKMSAVRVRDMRAREFESCHTGFHELDLLGVDVRGEYDAVAADALVKPLCRVKIEHCL